LIATIPVNKSYTKATHNATAESLGSRLHLLKLKPKRVDTSNRRKAVNKYTVNDNHTTQLKKALRETQTLRASSSKAKTKIFAQPQTPFPGGAGQPKFNQLEMVTSFTYKPSLVRINARNFELSW